MWTTKAVEICWWFLHEACSRHGWWRTQEVSRGTGERLGAVGETTQCIGSLLISLLVQWILEWGTKERKCFGLFFFFTLLQSFSPTLEARKLACSITSSPSSCIFPWAHSSQAKPVSKPRSICQAFLLLSIPPKSNTALIFITCAKQPTLLFLLGWHWRLSLSSSVPKV